jgi:putative transposase
MVKYRRYYHPGGTYFFTLTLQNRKADYLTQYINELGNAIRNVKCIHAFNTLAIVVLPDHLHTIWQLPEGDSNFSLRWRCIKTSFAANIKRRGVCIGKNQYNEHVLWQRRFWEHMIRDEKDFERHVNYIHYNPVKHHLVKQVKDWPYSSFHRFVKKGILPLNWSSDPGDFTAE